MQNDNEHSIFDHKPKTPKKLIVLPWGKTFRICLNNIRNRFGRSFLTFLCIVIVVAFFMSSLSYQTMIARLVQSKDIYTKAVLEKAGVYSHDPIAFQKQSDQKTWLLILSAVLCFVGITNTMLMSVTERIREIGTLKCLGALDSFIVRLFLVESIFIGILGSLAGTVSGFILFIIQILASLDSSILSISSFGDALVSSAPLSIAMGTILTVIAAVYPTFVAARMKPVEAMRVEV
ncbi:FtsX-like permease family protein [Candidatus Sumerlaeota bacterium]|nr:FtsX-like permease family protein [Candidatus Sumerlaeota bacterium]